MISNSDHLRRSPTDKPPFTLTQLKKSIPPHCFRRSAPRSLSYVVSDLCIVAALLYLALHQIPNLPTPYRYVAWPLYWFCQGCVLHGIMILGHECGHHAFSDYQTLDDTIGILLHSLILIPYFSFKYSHRRHHSNTCSLDLDEVFVPKPKSSLPSFFKYLNNAPGRFIYLFLSLALGWHSYLSFNVSGRSYGRFASHYDPYSPIYSDRERAQIIVSDVCVLSVYYALYRLTVSFSLSWVIRIYGVPLLVINGWVVLVTYLQHTHPGLPHYDSSEWDWIRGALATVDRDYGSILNWVFHDVTDAHVVHHLFSMIPHYHLREATEAIRTVLGEYYRFDGTPVWRAVWREAKECVYVEAEGEKRKGVYWYKNEL